MEHGREELRNGCVIMRGRVLSTSGELKHSSLAHDEGTCVEFILHPLFLAHLYLNSVASACDQNGSIEKGERGILNLVPLQRRRLHLARVHFQSVADPDRRLRCTDCDKAIF